MKLHLLIGILVMLLWLPQSVLSQVSGNVPPQYNFRSTSAYRPNENAAQQQANMRVQGNAFYKTYTVPMAAQEISMPTGEHLSPIRRGGSGGGGGFGPDNPVDPFAPPVGDVPWWLMVVLAGAVIIIKKSKTRKKDKIENEQIV